MLLQLRPRSYQDYLSLPILGSILDEFTSWSLQRGYTLKTIRNQLKDVRKLDNYFIQQGVQALEELTHKSFETAWYYYRLQRNLSGTIRQIELFLDETRGLSPIEPLPKTPTILEVERYREYLRDIRGFSAGTIQSHSSYIQEFLEYLGYERNRNAIKFLTSKDIESFIGICSKRMNRYSLQHLVAYLRSFLKFKYEEGVLRTSLHLMIDTPRTYRLEKLPRAFPWEVVNRLLLSVNRSSAHGIRDYTILYLMATYGLRASEITSLTLDSIDWRNGVIRIPQQKTRIQLTLPLSDAAGEVLIRYLKESRPHAPYRELFLRIRAPSGPLKPTAIHDILESRIRLSGLDLQYSGTHCLRHSCALHLLRQGSSLKAISGILGHRDTESTCVYLRLAVDDLREVALSIPEESSVDIPKNIKLKDYNSPFKKDNNAAKSLRITSSYSLRSFLREDIRDYIQLKRSLGRAYRGEARTLYSFDALLREHYPKIRELTPEIFNHWCSSLLHLSPTVRRRRMYIIHNFCLYRSRSYPQTFIPDILSFPKEHQPITPYIFSDEEIARLISATKSLHPYVALPLRAETLRLAIILLYTTGLRRGELLGLKLDDFNSNEGTLLIQNTKFHKSRILPLSSSVAGELYQYLTLRGKARLPMDTTSPLILNSCTSRAYTAVGLGDNFSALSTALKIFTRKGKTPRIHDFRHTFAVRVLERWYQKGEDVQTKLPLLSTYMGHVSINSTYYYLKFIEGIASEASTRFYENFGRLITKNLKEE
ncbi:MAG: tyrosine-type recombinase/integrase [bacterium]